MTKADEVDGFFFGKYVDEIQLLRNFLGVARFGINRASSADIDKMLLEIVSKSVSLPEGSDGFFMPEEMIGDFAKDQKNNGFLYLYQLAVVRLWSILESVIDESVIFILAKVPRPDLPLAVKAIRGPIVEFVESDTEAQNEFLLDALKKDVGASLKTGVGRFESLLDSVGFGGPVDDLVRKTILELSEVRHAIVHRMGRADRKLLKRCPWLKLEKSQLIPISSGDMQRYFIAVDWYIFQILDRTFDTFAMAKVTGRDCSANHEVFAKHMASYLQKLAALVGTQKLSPDATPGEDGAQK